MKIKLHLFITAIICITVGVLCVVSPVQSFGTITKIMGWLILISGTMSLIFGIGAKALLPNASSTVTVAIFQMLIGIIFLLNSKSAGESLIAVFAMWVLFEGVSVSVGAIDYRRAGYNYWWLMLIFGVVGILLSALAICQPDIIAVVITNVVGLGIIAIGVVRLTAIPAISRMQRKLKEVEETRDEDTTK